MATIRISNADHKVLKEISAVYGVSMQIVLSDALEQYHRQKFMEGLDDDFRRLRENKKLWKEELNEREMWNIALNDDLDST